MGQLFRVVGSLRSAGGAGEMLMMSTWFSQWPKPVPLIPSPAAVN